MAAKKTHPVLSLAWKDAKEWFFKPREIVPLVVIGVATYLALHFWAPKSDKTGAVDALFALAAVGCAALVIPTIVYFASIATAPHRLMRTELARVSQIVGQLVHNTNTPGPSGLFAKDDAIRTNEKIEALSAELTTQTKYLQSWIAHPGVSPNYRNALEKTRSVVKTELSTADLASLDAYETINPSTRPEAPVPPYYESEWREGDAFVRWLAQRIEQLRKAL